MCENDLDESQKSLPGGAWRYPGSFSIEIGSFENVLWYQQVNNNSQVAPTDIRWKLCRSQIKWKKQERRKLEEEPQTPSWERQRAEDVGSVFLATVAASAQTFSFFFFFFLLFPSGAVLTHDINLHCYTHQCWFIATLVWRKRRDKRFCWDERRLGKRQRWGEASLIVFVVFLFLPLLHLHRLTFKVFFSAAVSRFLSCVSL